MSVPTLSIDIAPPVGAAGESAQQAAPTTSSIIDSPTQVSALVSAAMDIWPSVPRSLPASSAGSLYHDTSLEPPRLNARAPATARLTLVQRRILAAQDRMRQRTVAEAATHHRDRLFDAVIRQANIRANNEADKLYAHYALLSKLKSAYDSSVHRFSKEDAARSAAFEQHCANCDLLSDGLAEKPLRYFDLVTWYQHAPSYLRGSLKDLTDYYAKQSKLRRDLNGYERRAGSVFEKISSEEQYAAAAFDAGQPGHGMWNELIDATIGSFHVKSFDNHDDEVKYLRASFEVRKVRLEQERSKKFRFPRKQPFASSLDGAVLDHCHNLRRHYQDASGQLPNDLAPSLRRVMDEVAVYATRIETRRDRIEQLSQADPHRQLPGVTVDMMPQNPY